MNIIRVISAVLIGGLTVSTVNAENKLFNISQEILIGSNILDVSSSYNKSELNPLLKNSSGKMDISGIAIKAGILAGSIFAERYICKKERTGKAKKSISVVNLGVSGVITGISIRNFKK